MKRPRAASQSTPIPTPEPSSKPEATELSFWSMFWKTSFLSLLFASLLLLLTALILGLWGYGRFRQFIKAAEINQPDFIAQISQGWRTSPQATNEFKNILVLGTDSTTDRGNIPALTDTMILVSINLDQGKINTLPLPRDLWSEDYQTKINALYAYGLDRYPEKPEQFPTEVITDMTGVPIHHTIVLSFDQLKELIELAGGVEITIEKGFTDPLFPRAGVDVTTERDPTVLYESVTFEPGTQTLSGERALKYIRSRHSEDEQGHDLARGQRQQQVIEALLAQLTDYKTLIAKPQLAGQLYRFYELNFSQYLGLSELVSTAKALLPARKSLTFQSHQLTDVDDDPVNGVLENPPLSRLYQNQWVYIIADEEKLMAVIADAFFSRN